MKIKKISESPVNQEDLLEYKNKISKLEGVVFNAADVDMDKRIITIRLGEKENELTLVNPKPISKSDKPLVYFEKDTYKNKVRKTIRYPN